jgi:hypothetical protein
MLQRPVMGLQEGAEAVTAAPIKFDRLSHALTWTVPRGVKWKPETKRVWGFGDEAAMFGGGEIMILACVTVGAPAKSASPVRDGTRRRARATRRALLRVFVISEILSGQPWFAWV